MTYKNFSEIIDRLKSQHQLVGAACKLKIDLIEFSDDLYKIIDILFKEVYGEEGKEWIDWFLYDHVGDENGKKAWDKAGNPICYSVESLWQYLEANHKGVSNELSKNG